jgi:hypothetical protein
MVESGSSSTVDLYRPWASRENIARSKAKFDVPGKLSPSWRKAVAAAVGRRLLGGLPASRLSQDGNSVGCFKVSNPPSTGQGASYVPWALSRARPPPPTEMRLACKSGDQGGCDDRGPLWFAGHPASDREPVIR